ncbi:hypothetical protein COY95_05205, partial [Candidatus Woesearchaeota archaeon CG_4_10_14_0_8_um_filter_47_5]
LQEFADKYDSPMLARSFHLIIEGIKGGGRISDLIDKIVDNIKETKLLKQEMVAANMSYIIFITIIVLVIGPALYALSYQLLIILSNLTSQLAASGSGASPMGGLAMSEVSIKPEDYVLFTRLSLIATSICSSMVVSMIRKGNVKGGVQYIPIFIVVSQVVYYFTLKGLSGMFGSLG